MVNTLQKASAYQRKVLKASWKATTTTKEQKLVHEGGTSKGQAHVSQTQSDGEDNYQEQS